MVIGTYGGGAWKLEARVQRTSFAAIACIAASGCAFNTPPIANPTGLPADALTLEHVLDKGCLPYVLGQMAEPEAMHGAGLHHIQPIVPGLMPGDNAPFWTGGYTGALRVNVGRGVCNISLRGGNFAAYRDATESVVGRTLGVDAAVDGRSGYKAWLSGQVTGCGRGVRYTYYPQPSGHGFSVELSRVSDCAHDPLRVAG